MPQKNCSVFGDFFCFYLKCAKCAVLEATYLVAFYLYIHFEMSVYFDNLMAKTITERNIVRDLKNNERWHVMCHMKGFPWFSGKESA